MYSKLSSLKTTSVLATLFVCIGFFVTYADTVTCTLGNSCSASPSSTSVSATVGLLPSVDTGGGVVQSGVRFSGYAYPNAVVTIQKGFEQSTTTTADANGVFSILIPETNWEIFTLFATDVAGRRSTLLNFPVALYSGYLTEIKGIRFAPTITTDKLSIKKGDFITVSGAAVPGVQVQVVIDGSESMTYTLFSDAIGTYSATIPAGLRAGEYTIRARYQGDTRSSKALRLIIGNVSLNRDDNIENIPGDCNADQKITIVDFSVLAYWYGKENPPACVDTNADHVIDLVDFSILAYYWSE